MGMGKSLSTLSLVAKTFDDAHLWAEEQESSQELSSSIVKKRVPVTLVIAPSVSK
jgi:hypothetical protein